jgi:lipopolysaccharide heptosyltransferase II
MHAIAQRILIVRLGAIGDVVNATVLATALRRAAPALRIGWVVHELARSIVDGHPSVNRVHVWRKPTRWRELRALVGEIRRERYDVALDLQRLAKSAALARASGAPRVVGFDRARSKEWSWLLTREHLGPRAHTRPMVEQYLEFAQHLGYPVNGAALELPRSAGAAQVAAALRARFDAPPVLLHVGATKPANRWPVERFASVGRVLLDAGVPVAITGGPAESELARRALIIEPRIVDLVGSTSLIELAELQRLARFVISCDSGPMHLAAAAGARVLALFGPADERRTGPYGAGHRVLRTQPACAPCGRKSCNQVRHACMEDLRAEEVARVALEWARAQLGPEDAP